MDYSNLAELRQADICSYLLEILQWSQQQLGRVCSVLCLGIYVTSGTGLY